MKAEALALLLVGGLLRQEEAPAELDDRTFPKWRDTIAAKTDELRWARIPWRPSVAQALADAKAEDRPAVLWVMNGHPLGNC